MTARRSTPARSGHAAEPGDRASSRGDEIRRAALELFATLGYRATTMEDIGNLAGIRGPSVYRHVGSKHELLAAIMTGTMERLLGAQQAAIVGDPDPREVVRRLVAAHVHYHALHRFETFVGNREIENLEPEPHRQVLRLRARYETTLRQVIARGTESGAFAIESARLASYALLDMGIGVSTWHDPRGRYSPDDLSRIYADMAVQMLTGPR